ncbi:hypothetical protein ACFLXI_07135 [Chloroflexota bacterium]
MVGRFIGFSFVSVKYIFAFIGLVEILILIKSRPDLLRQKYDLFGKIRNSAKNLPLLATLFIGCVMLFNSYLFFVDDWTYLAYLTNWQQSVSLNFNEVIYGGYATDAARFWFALYPMGQALLSALSNVSGILLLGNYLEFFLMPIAILSMYYFARKLGLSARAAGFSVLAHIALFCWLFSGNQDSIGMWFIRSMSEDKVSGVYILAPVAFSFAIDYFKEPVFRNFLLFFLAGFSISITHPVILFFFVCILFGLTVISFLIRKLSWKNIVKITLVIVIWMSPFIAMRIIDHPSIKIVAYNAKEAEGSINIEKLIKVSDNGLYSIPTDILKFADVQIGPMQNAGYQIFRTIPLLIIFGAGLIGLIKVKRDFIYSYLFSCAVLIFGVMIPYTGWLLGSIVSARMISRAPWFAPFGIGLVVIVKTGLEYIRARIPTEKKLRPGTDNIVQSIYTRIPLWGFIFLLIFGLASPAMVGVVRSVPNLVSTLNFHRQLGQVGAYISNNNDEKVAVITLNATDNYLPGLAASAKPISFRDEVQYFIKYFITSEELDERRRDSRIIQSLEADVTLDERRDLLYKYEIKYILADTQQVATYLEVMNESQQLVEIVYQTKDFTLFQVNDFGEPDSGSS